MDEESKNGWDEHYRLKEKLFNLIWEILPEYYVIKNEE
jgi:hypothetical protein